MPGARTRHGRGAEEPGCAPDRPGVRAAAKPESYFGSQTAVALPHCEVIRKLPYADASGLRHVRALV